jgi:hypothetical protein
MVLVAQALALLVRPRAVRWTLSLAGTAAIAAMFVYVATLPLSADEGANIGAGVLFLWLSGSIGLLLAAITRKPAPARHNAAGSGSGWATAAIVSSLFMLFLPAWPLVVVPIGAILVSWSRESASRLRLVATVLTALAVLYVLVYVLVTEV